MPIDPLLEKSVLVHHAGTATEAVVLRSLLASAGITSPAPTVADPFPMREAPEGFNDTDIVVLEDQADAARQLIADYLAGGPLSDEPADPPPGPNPQS
jgi:hypothetical protein